MPPHHPDDQRESDRTKSRVPISNAELHTAIAVAKHLRTARDHENPTDRCRIVATELRDIIVRHGDRITDDAYHDIRDSLDNLVGPSEGILRAGIDEDIDWQEIGPEVNRVAAQTEAMYRGLLRASEVEVFEFQSPDDRPSSSNSTDQEERKGDTGAGHEIEELENQLLAAVRLTDFNSAEPLDILTTILATGTRERKARAALALVRAIQTDGNRGATIVGKALDSVANALNDSAPRLARKRCALVIVEVAESHRIDTVIPTIGSALSDPNETVRKRVALAMYYESERVKSETSPARTFDPVIPQLVDALTDDVSTVRTRIALVVQQLASRTPDRLAPVVPELARVAAHDSEYRVQVRLCKALHSIAAVAPDRVSLVQSELETVREQYKESEPITGIVDDVIP